jgi:hypothetical protein
VNGTAAGTFEVEEAVGEFALDGELLSCDFLGVDFLTFTVRLVPI